MIFSTTGRGLVAKTSATCAVVLCTSLFAASVAQAAFVIEAHSSGKANATNFSFGAGQTTAGASVPSAAVGLTASNSVFGGDGNPDTYVFSYTPGVDVDNTVFAPGTVLGSTTSFPGEGNVASGLPGGTAGLYNVYFTAPESTNVHADGSRFVITQDGAPIDLMTVVLNNTGTGPDTDPGSAFVGGANNAWFKLGTVSLTPGTTYTVTQSANSGSTFVSQRAHAVMFEAIPEPGTLALAVVAAAGLLFFGRRRK